MTGADRIKARAVRQCGKLLKEMAVAGERRDRKENLSKSQAATSKTLKDLGISRDESSRFQQIAAVPEADFERQVESEKPPTIADCLALIDREIARLLERNDPDAKDFARTLTRWRAGEQFDGAVGLPPGNWRRMHQDAVRAAAVTALVQLHPELDDSPLAERIAAGVARAARRATKSQRRPEVDGEDRHYVDLAGAGVDLAPRTWRWLVARARGKADDDIANRS